MLGSSDNPGVMYLTMKELFGRIDLIKEEKVFDMAFSYLEIILLKLKLKEYEERKVEPPTLNPISSQRRAEFEKMSDSLRSAFEAQRLVRQEQLDIEKQLKENRMRLSHRQEWHQQSLLFFPDKVEKATCKYKCKLASLQSQQQHLQQRLEESKRRFQENKGWLHRIENEMKLLGHDGQTPEVSAAVKGLWVIRVQSM
ncbi:hypothetical protein SRHO_G00306190 [Serrasalmus rhombeus]